VASKPPDDNFPSSRQNGFGGARLLSPPGEGNALQNNYPTACSHTNWKVRAEHLPLAGTLRQMVLKIGIQDSVAFVTGANRGIVLAFARELMAAGARKVYTASP
jgi:hypothetical protein